MNDVDEEIVAPSMPDLDAVPGDSVNDKKGKMMRVKKKPIDEDWSGLIKMGYGMLLFGLLMILIMGLDSTTPAPSDYDSSEDYYDALESHQLRQDLYPALFIFAFFGGVIFISGGLVTHGINEKNELHHYVRIAVIISGVFILGLFISGFFDILLMSSVF